MTNQRVTNQLAQPPTLDLELFDGANTVGWLSSHAVGFRGFASEAEAMHAAWVAHRTLARRLAHREGRRPMPIDIEPLTLKVDDSVHASGRRIATLLRPSPHSNSGESFGFELRFPTRMDELSARAKSMHIYRTLRRSGVRWSMWRPEQRHEWETRCEPAGRRDLARASNASHNPAHKKE